MIYTCGCSFTTSEYHEMDAHKKKCGKPVNEEFVPERQEIPQRKADGSLKDFITV